VTSRPSGSSWCARPNQITGTTGTMNVFLNVSQSWRCPWSLNSALFPIPFRRRVLPGDLAGDETFGNVSCF
jgi:hypothetical protein